MATREATIAAQNSVAVRLGPGAAALLVMDDHTVRGEPSRALEDLAEELGPMAARAMLRALDNPKAGELVFRLVLLFISIVVIAGGHNSTLGCAD